MSEKRTVATIKNIGYSMMNGISVSLEGYPYLLFIKPENLKMGGKNCEISDLVVGGKIEYVGGHNTATRQLYNVTIISDTIREVDSDGNLIKW